MRKTMELFFRGSFYIINNEQITFELFLFFRIVNENVCRNKCLVQSPVERYLGR